MSAEGPIPTYSLEDFRSVNAPIIDVRSPKEFDQGHWPNAKNIPLFSNKQREVVGTTYKKEGREEAILLGLKITVENIGAIKKSFKFHFDKELSEKEGKLSNLIRIYCWRGGMRSRSIGWLANVMGFEPIILDGGYKNYRKWVLEMFDYDWPIRLLAGRTGTGKTDMLLSLSSSNKEVFVIDLEGLANHRGSSFGSLGLDPQPSTQQYENTIAEALKNFERGNASEIWMEAESANLGKCRIPQALFNQMKGAPRLEILRSKNERIEKLVSVYSKHSKIQLKEAVLRISKRLGSERSKEAIKAIEVEDWAKACSSMLDYYDKCYDYELKNANNVQTIDLTELPIDLCIKKIANQVNIQ